MSPPTQADKVPAKIAPSGPAVVPPSRPATFARGTDRIAERPKPADEKARTKAEAAKAKVKAKIEAAKAKQRAQAAAEHARATAKADAKAKATADAAKAKADLAKARAKAKLEQAQAKADAAKGQPLDKGPPLGTPQPVTLLTLFVPGVERDGKTAIDQDRWVEEALQCISRWFGRATAYPAGQGVYRDSTGKELRETMVPIQCHAPVKALKDAKKRAELAAFCRRMGQQTKQDEVGLVIGPNYHAIRIATR